MPIALTGAGLWIYGQGTIDNYKNLAPQKSASPYYPSSLVFHIGNANHNSIGLVWRW
jgi:hypothetical protein